MSESTSHPAQGLVPYPETLDLRRLTATVQRFSPHTSRVSFTGTVKVHGTNISVVFRSRDQPAQVQSRRCILTPQSDPYNAAKFLTPNLPTLREKLERVGLIDDDCRPSLDTATSTGAVQEMSPLLSPAEIMVAGEFAGKGIQKGVGVSNCAPFFVVFAVCVNGMWMPPSSWKDVHIEPARIYNIQQFTMFRTTVDFFPTPPCDENQAHNNTWSSEIDKLTQSVEDECPVALQLGNIRKGVGEGVVWTEESDIPLQQPLRFKSKGPKHSVVEGAARPEKAQAGEESRVKTQQVQQFVEYAVTTPRLNQGLDYLREQGVSVDGTALAMKNIPVYGKWVLDDVIKEEKDVLSELGLLRADVSKVVLSKAKDFFKAQVESGGGGGGGGRGVGGRGLGKE